MLSIIIPTYNEERYLPLLLDSINKQDFKDYELIVSDARSKDRTRQKARKYGCRIVNGGLPAKGRNNGAKAARGELLLFLDADVILPKGFLKENIDFFMKKRLAAAGVWARPISKKAIDSALFGLSQSAQRIMLLFRPVAMGWCIFIKKDVFMRIRGFDEKLLVGEDYDLAYRAGKLGRFMMVGKKKVYVSVRRLDKEGRLKFILKLLKTTFYDITGRKMTLKNKVVEYEFGGYDKIKVIRPKVK